VEEDCPVWAVDLKVRLARVETDMQWVKNWIQRGMIIQAGTAIGIGILTLLLKLSGVL